MGKKKKTKKAKSPEKQALAAVEAKSTTRMQMVSVDTTCGSVMFGGQLYDRDLVRACIRPFANAVSKVELMHVRGTGSEYETFPDPVIKAILKDPNPLMGMPTLLKKVAVQYKLTSNAYIYIARDAAGYPMELYPIDCTGVIADLRERDIVLDFGLTNGKRLKTSYSNIIHLRNDMTASDPIFGRSPKVPLEELLDLLENLDRSIEHAIKNSGIIRWLLKYSSSMRPEDLKANVKQFVDNYLSVESETFGAAGVDAKAEAQRIEPKDYVPNQAIQNAVTKRLFQFFNTNEKIVSGTFTEDEWNSYYESDVEEFLIQLADEFTRKLFTRHARAFGNRVTCQSANLEFASMKTKLGLVGYVDRSIMSRNEVRTVMNYAPIEGGDEMLLRKDTAELGGEGNEEN